MAEFLLVVIISDSLPGINDALVSDPSLVKRYVVESA
jgi:hypothetical protein